MSLYETNVGIVKKRWPQFFLHLDHVIDDEDTIELIKDNQLSLVFNQLQVASSYDQHKEAQIQLQVLSPIQTKVTLYGTGLGILPNILVENNNLLIIDVVVLNLSLFKASLKYFEQQKWLGDTRVNLCLAKTDDKVAANFIALPAELALASDESAALRDRLCLALDNQFINIKNGINNKKLRQQIIDNIPFVKGDHDITSLYLSGTNKDYIVCGAGPTLSEHFVWLKHHPSRKDFILIAVDAAVIPLINNGIMPDIIISIDPISIKLFEGLDMGDFKNIPLVYFPIVASDLLSAWQGPRYTAYSMGELYNDINRILSKGRLYCAGSVIHPAIDLAVKMGANNVVFLGADFSFPNGKTHTHWHEKNSKSGNHLEAEKSQHWVMNSLDERVPTLLNYRGYLRDLEDYIALVPHVNFYNGSKKGAAIKGTYIWPALL